MFEQPALSFVVPVYNRPGELAELFATLTEQTVVDFEVVIVEDGSRVRADSVVADFGNRLPITYVETPNGGPAKARNIGAEKVKSDYMVFLDSDVLLPKYYVGTVLETLRKANVSGEKIDLFGGPDRAHPSFSDIQKAIDYAMTSPLTTGGIRGGKKHVGSYQPRTFNMGVSQALFRQVGGFDSGMRFGEDIDFSLRCIKAGARVALLHEAYVYHKRRVDFRKFFRQVYNSGAARIALTRRHPGSLKPVHLLPSAATLVGLLVFIFSWWEPALWLLWLLAALIVAIDAAVRTGSLRVALLTVPAVFIQIVGYGSGLIIAAIKAYLLRRERLASFEKTFYD